MNFNIFFYGLEIDTIVRFLSFGNPIAIGCCDYLSFLAIAKKSEL